MSEEDSGEKEFDASQKRLDDARARGEIPKSLDLNAAASYIGFALACLIAGASGIIAFGNAFSSVLGQSERLAPLMMQSLAAPTAAIGLAFGLPTLPLFLAPAVAVILVLYLQGAISFTADNLQMKLSRISPLATAKQKFGIGGLVEFAKNGTKMVVVGVLLSLFLSARATEILGSLYLDTATSIALLLRLFLEFLFLIAMISTSFGALDYLWQRVQHAQKNRMSRKEMMDEMKESEGDPHVKQTRRARGQEIATNRMLADVPTADVIIVNPTHYAVALKWSRDKGAAPICVAKGVDEVAARIRQAAQEAKVPVHSDPPTARALYATVDLGAEILPEHYRAVAAAIRFAEKMRKLAKSRRGSGGPEIKL
jgi:flagellar biosynthetic protein FlhB